MQAGQASTIKLETFPFTRYGTVDAQVKTVAADAVNDEKRGAIFPALLTLNTSTAGQLGMTFNTGMSATGAGNFQDLNFSFGLTGLNNLVMFIGDKLNFNGSATGGASTGP
mgnify:CR=1 FL=1